MTNKKYILAYLALGLGVIALSFSPMFVRWANAPGPVTGFYRLLFSIILLTPFFIHRQAKSEPLSPIFYLYPALAGLFTSLDFAIWNSSLAFTTAANATLLGNTAPLWVALGAWLIFKEHLIPRFWLGLFLALTGAALIMGVDFFMHPRIGLGDLMASVAAMFYAGYMLTTQRGRQHFDPFRYTWTVAVFAALGMLIINLILKNPFTGYDERTWLVFIAFALVSQTIGYLCISYALGHLPARVVSPTLIGQPILSAIFAVPLLGEIPTLWQGLGGLIALLGIYIVNQSHDRELQETSRL